MYIEELNRQIIRMIRNCFKRVKLTQRDLIYFYKTGVQNQPRHLFSNQQSYQHNEIQNRETEKDWFQFTSTTTPCTISLQMQNLACGNLPQPRSAQNYQAQEQVITKVLSQTIFSHWHTFRKVGGVGANLADLADLAVRGSGGHQGGLMPTPPITPTGAQGRSRGPRADLADLASPIQIRQCDCLLSAFVHFKLVEWRNTLRHLLL